MLDHTVQFWIGARKINIARIPSKTVNVLNYILLLSPFAYLWKRREMLNKRFCFSIASSIDIVIFCES